MVNIAVYPCFLGQHEVILNTMCFQIKFTLLFQIFFTLSDALFYAHLSVFLLYCAYIFV